jgi:hypothetical protein
MGKGRLTRTSSSTPLVARCMNQRVSLVRSASTTSMKPQVRLTKGKGPRCVRRTALTEARQEVGVGEHE